MVRYVYIGALVLLAAVSFETAYKFLLTPLTTNVQVGFKNPVYIGGWIKQIVGVLSFAAAVLSLKLILGVFKEGKPKESKKSKEKPPLAD